jgi:hypothetical protein
VVPKEHLGLAHVVAGIVDGDGVVVDGRIQLDPALVDILFEEFLDGDYFELSESFRKPIFEPDPGCIVCVPSFGEQNGFAF